MNRGFHGAAVDLVVGSKRVAQLDRIEFSLLLLTAPGRCQRKFVTLLNEYSKHMTIRRQTSSRQRKNCSSAVN